MLKFVIFDFSLQYFLLSCRLRYSWHMNAHTAGTSVLIIFFFIVSMRTTNSSTMSLRFFALHLHVGSYCRSRHSGDIISPRTWYHYSAILAMIIREYLFIDHYPITADDGTGILTTRLSLAEKADLLVQLVRCRCELILSCFSTGGWPVRMLSRIGFA